MISLEPAAVSFFVSFVLVSPFVAALRPRVLSFAVGAVLVTVGALVLELAVVLVSSPYADEALLVVLAAPAIEELLKFTASGFTGANYASAAGSGLGFAAAENGVYILAAWGEPTSNLVLLVAVRAVTDPLLHSTTTTLATLTWHGRWWGLPAGIALHSLWNTLSLFAAVFPTVTAVLLLFAAALGIAGLAVALRRAPELMQDLSDDRRYHPMLGSFTSTG